MELLYVISVCKGLDFFRFLTQPRILSVPESVLGCLTNVVVGCLLGYWDSIILRFTDTSAPLPPRPLVTSAPSHLGPNHLGPRHLGPSHFGPTVTSAPSPRPLVTWTPFFVLLWIKPDKTESRFNKRWLKEQQPWFMQSKPVYIFVYCFFFGTRLTVYSYSHYLYKQLKTPGMLRHTVYSTINRLEQINFIRTSFP